MYNNGGYSPKVQSMNQTSGYIHMNLIISLVARDSNTSILVLSSMPLLYLIWWIRFSMSSENGKGVPFVLSDPGRPLGKANKPFPVSWRM